LSTQHPKLRDQKKKMVGEEALSETREDFESERVDERRGTLKAICRKCGSSEEDSENTLPNNEVNVGLEASPSGPSVLGDKGSEVCATADPPEIADPHNNRKRHRE
ncbi:unnamed protein product, partial [Brassica oleracea var. botrytis]